MGGIFISYRRDDSGPYAGRLRDALIHHFGANQVFRDRDSITPGERFPTRVERELSSCVRLAGRDRVHLAGGHRRCGSAPAGRPRRLGAPGDRDRPRTG